MLFTREGNPGADIVLESSDKKKYYVHRSNLVFGSKVFLTTLNIPQPVKSESSTADGMPIIPLSEDTATLLSMLPYFYPYLSENDFLHKRSKLSVQSIFEGLCFVDKYEMHQLVKSPLIAALQKRIGAFTETRRKSRKRHRNFEDSEEEPEDDEEPSNSANIQPTPTAKPELEELLCLFSPRCPAFLHGMKVQILPEVARYVFEPGHEVTREALSEADMKDIMAFRRQSALGQMLKHSSCDMRSKLARQACASTASRLADLVKSDLLLKPNSITSLPLHKACESCLAFIRNVELVLFSA